tara:strand:+ start:257344 stop:258114 length:771 start_codon:yes stop_codon:yes gene_type:complete
LTRRWLSNSYSHSKRAGEFAALLLLIGSTNASMADSTADSAVTLRPYIAQYMTTTRGMDLALTRQLKQGADGSYTLTNGGKIMVVGFHEVSVFDVEGDRIVPRSYVYQGTGLINRRREVHFTPGSPIVRSLYKEQWYDLPRSQKTLDRMSQQEQLRLRLLNDPTPRGDIAVQIADGKRVKDYTLVFVGEELVQTPLGAVKSLHFTRIHDDPERKSDIWLAPDWDYLMVKTLHVEDESPVEITLTSATIEGQPVAPL